jgi:hypothetical protein
VIFFSESCRSSFDGGNLSDRKNEMSWFKIRQYIETQCDSSSSLHYLGECANNDDPNNMAFGVSAFCTKGYLELIENILPRRILTEGFGSGALGIKFTDGSIVWGIHFPLDFKGKGANNLGAKAMAGLCHLMKTQIGSICAIGDFNTIPGEITECIKDAIMPGMHFIIENQLTFFGAFYDSVKTDDKWIPIN